ncbi:MAG: type IV secretion system protein [Rickettsiales endosymbiont of Dermacentor nuttalli]
MKKECNKFLILILFCNLVGCKDWNQPCIDADDFGFNKINISARGETIYGHDLSVLSQKGQEVSSWTDARLTLTGGRLIILVRNGDNSRWTAWWGSKGDTDNVPIFLRDLRACTKSDWGCNKLVDTSNFYDPDNICLFTKGVGLYALAVPKGTDPNASESVLKKIPDGSIVFHLGENTPLIDSDGESAGGWNDSLPSEAPANGYLYLRILDSYYDDNGGQYQLVFKGGVADPYPGPIATVVGYVKYHLDTAAKSIYNNLVNETEYLTVTRICLILYIMFLGISFMFGIVNITQKELAVHIFKIALIIQVSATATSWTFFNDNFLNIFKQGVDSLVCMMVGTLGGVGCDPGASPLNYFDNLVATFTSFETNAKIQSLLFTSFLGFVFVLIFYVSLIVYIIAIAKAVILYLLAYIAICVLITLFPIFIVFILFKMTRELFNNWLKQIIGYSIQVLMVMAGLTLMAQVVLHQLHVLVGFPVCVKTLLEIPSPFNVPLIVYWYPKEVRTDPTKDLRSIYVPEYWSRDGNVFAGCDPEQKNFACKNQNLCAPYECQDTRYPDLPYLIPAKSSEKQYNQDRINRISSGTYVTFFDVFLFLVLVYIMLKFQKIVPDIAKGVAGVVIGSQTNLAATADSAFEGITSGALTQLVYKNITGGRDLARDIDYVKDRVMLTGLKHRVQDTIGGSIDAMHSKIGKKLTPRPIQKLSELNKRGEDFKHGLQDKIGGKVDSIKEVGGMIKDQALYNVSGGHFGKSMNGKVNPYENQYLFYKDPNQVRTNLDGVAERFGEAFGIKPQYNQELKGIFNNASNNIVGDNNKFTKYLIGGVILANPLVGGIFASLYSVGMLGNIANQIYALRQRSLQGSVGTLGDAGPGFSPDLDKHTPQVRRTGLDRTGSDMFEQSGSNQSVRRREVKKFEHKKKD